MVCVSCTTSSDQECLVEACPSRCTTKEAVEKIKDAVLQAKAKAKPILSLAIKTSEDEKHGNRREGKKSAVAVGSDIQNPFPPGKHGLCPHCSIAADVSTLQVDARNRVWCKEPHCKTRSHIRSWFCVMCSAKANSQKRSGREVRIEFENCVCYAKILSQQGKVIVSCPQVKCQGWNDYDKLPASRDARITCGVCGERRPVVEWHCFTCNMPSDICICKLPEQTDKSSVRKRPASKGLPKANPKRRKRE